MRPRLLAPFAALLALAAPLGATWSIVAVNLRTREVAVGSATCLVGFNLRNGVPVIVVGEGAAAAQSVIDLGAVNRRRIYESFLNTEETPAQILARLTMQSRQYGIVNFTGDPVTFSGNGTQEAFGGVTGRVGDYLYAIQGNILVGEEVWLAAEEAFRLTEGDMGQRLMAGMEAARALGGDGRCSCGSDATSCGVPPPGFRKSAHVGFMIVARMGDVDAPCDDSRGCALGSYYMTLNVIGRPADPDPVITLKERYTDWRTRHQGRPDGIFSRAKARPVPADGVSLTELRVALRDIDDRPMTRGGSVLEVSTVDGAAPLLEVGTIKDNGDGTYSIPLRAGEVAGVERLLIRVVDVDPVDPGAQVATLWPPVEVPVVDARIRAGVAGLSASEGGVVPVQSWWPEKAQRVLALVVRVSGDSRLGRFGPGARPRAFLPGAPFSVRTLRLDGRGWAEDELEVPPGALSALVGGRIELRALALDGPPPDWTETVHVSIEQ